MVHLMIFQPLHTYWLKSAGPHMQGDESSFYPPACQQRQHRFIKMQACRWRRHSTRMFGVYRLIALTIKQLVGPVDIRG